MNRKVSRVPRRHANRVRPNKRLQTRGFQFPRIVSGAIVVLLGGATWYLALCTRTDAITQQISIREHELERLRREVGQEEARWSEMTGPGKIQQALARHRVHMDWAKPERTVHVRDMNLWYVSQGQSQVYTSLTRREDQLRP